ncbi:MAG: hypothetical protein Q9169_004521 [Polycauliona sp. 2 TL-2023]
MLRRLFSTQQVADRGDHLTPPTGVTAPRTHSMAGFDGDAASACWQVVDIWQSDSLECSSNRRGIIYSIGAGAIVGVLAGGAAVAALPLAIPKALSQPILEGDGPEPGGENNSENEQCEEKIAKVCTEDCSLDWFVSSKKAQITSKCSTATCADTTGCSVADATKTNTQSISVGEVATYTTSATPGSATAAPLRYVAIQIYLAQEYLRLHIDGNGANANSDAQCAKDPSKGSLERKGIQVWIGSLTLFYEAQNLLLQDYIASFCKSNNGIAASPNTPLLVTYDQVQNRMQMVLQVSYTGKRGQGAIYTINE